MYSVIILNEKSKASFSEYQILFSDAIRNNRIGICRWVESGTTIDTALPELRSLTDDKQEWRAIIVRHTDDPLMSSFETDPKNPYDFLVNRAQSEDVSESQIPLVRLSQMLGGVPPLEVQFRAEIIRDDNQAARTVYVPIEDEARQYAYGELVKKYRFDGRLPSSILFVTFSDNDTFGNEAIGKSWLTHKESNSSNFWKRNAFPSTCRFIVYHATRQGPVQKDADDFDFWYSIMLLSLNEWDAGTLQAYRLYSVNTKFDRGQMLDSFQMMVNRMRDARYSLEESIRAGVDVREAEENDLPRYYTEVPVAIKSRRIKETIVNDAVFPLLSEGSNSDESIWRNQRRTVEDNLAVAVRSAERSLDESAEKMRAYCRFTEAEVNPLSQYQEEDMTREANDLFNKIVRMQGLLPKENLVSDAEVQQTSEKVFKFLQGRVEKAPAIGTFFGAVLVWILTSLPAIIRFFRNGEGAATILLWFAGIGALCLFAAATLALLRQKWKLHTLVKDYNQHLRSVYRKLVEKADDYSTYLSDIASHSRAMSYLQLSAQLKSAENSENSLKYRHVRAIDLLLAKLKRWGRAYHLDLDFTQKRPNTRVEIDISAAPSINKLYTFPSDDPKPVTINNSGITMQSPYSFAERIEIVREELYDDE